MHALIMQIVGLQAKTEELVTVDVSEVSGWKDDDPTIFELAISARLQGEFQVTNGYGPIKAPQVMKVYTYITLTTKVWFKYKFRVRVSLNAAASNVDRKQFIL